MSDTRAVQWDCQRVMTQFFNRIDGRDFAGVAGLFAEDCAWFRRGAVLRGPAEIRAALAAKSATAHIRHVMSNVLVDVEGRDRAGGTCYVVAFSRDTGRQESPPILDAVPEGVVLYAFGFIRSGSAWLIARLTLQWAFKRPD